MIVSLKMIQSVMLSVAVTTALANSPIAPAFDALYKGIQPNYSPQQPGASSPGRDVMICIMPDNYAAAFQAYAAWKHKSGTFIKIVKFSEIGASNSAASCSTAIKPYIQKAYTSWTYKPTHVLLVGDAGVFPVKMFFSATEETYMANNATDAYFGEVSTANGYAPDLMVGRLCVKDTAEMGNLLRKLMQYEREPYTTNTTWFKRGVALSDNEIANFGDSTLQAETVREASKIQLSSGFNVDTLMCTKAFKGDLSSIITSINKGCSIINYRGQGWSDGWHSGCYQFTVNDLSKVQNGRMLAFITGIGCGIGMFNTTGDGMMWSSTECFGEEWMRLGSSNAPRGACAVIGPTGNTHSYWNNEIDKGIYTGMFQKGLSTPGQALLAGIDAMYKKNLSDKAITDYQARLYVVLGDPSIHIWKDVPQTAAVTGPTSVPAGASSQTVTVKIGSQPVQSAQVCISGALNDSITYASGFTDANGSVTLSITVSAASTSLWLVARGGTIIPVEHQITIGTSKTVHHAAPATALLALRPLQPDPFASAALISYSLPVTGLATVAIYSLRGDLVRTLTSGIQSAGFHSLFWDGRNEKGGIVARGAYLLSLRQANNIVRRRITKTE